MGLGFQKFKSSTQERFNGPKTKKEKKGHTKEFIAKLSKGLMLPIAMLPIAGLFLGIGSAIVTAAGTPGVEGYNNGLAIFGNFLKIPGDVIFGALPVLFAIAIAIAFTKDAGPAALSAFVGFLVFSGLQAALIQKVEIDDKIIGYDLLFYTNGALGKYSDGAGLPTSLFGTVLGINQLTSSVFGGFIVGFTVSFLYNKFKNIQLPQVIGFFSGVRFIPIITFLSFFPITIIFLMLWPLIGILFNIIGGALGSNMLGFNSFIFGYIERALVPFGLHHAFYSPLWYSSVGGSIALTDYAIVGGQLVTQVGNVSNVSPGLTWGDVFKVFDNSIDTTGNISGDQVIWAALNNIVGKQVTLADGTTGIIKFSDFTSTVYNDAYKTIIGNTSGIASAGVNAGQYMQGKYTFMMFGLPAAAFAMIMAAPKGNRKMSASIVASAGLTSFLTGITEPLEFTFLFLAPWLFWGVHALLCALSFGLMNWIGLIFPDLAPHIGMTFSGGAIDWVIYGAIQIPGGSNAWWALVFGVAYAPIYFFLFYFLIKKFNIQTPGRGENTKLFSKQDFLNKKNSEGENSSSDKLEVSPNRAMAIEIVKAYGGIDNIKNVDACITKLRIQVANQDIVDENKLKNELGAMGVIKPSKQSVYSIYGAKADLYKNEINEILNEIEKDPCLKDKLFNEPDDFVSKEQQVPEPVLVTNSVQSNSATTPIQEPKVNHQENKNTNNIAADPKTYEVKTADEYVIVYAPVDCEVVDIKNVPDETFSKEIVGKGVAIRAHDNQIGSVIFDGQMELAFNTGHAYSFKTLGGTQILMHVGVDSASIKDENQKQVNIFDQEIKTGDHVNINSKVVKVDLDKLSKYAKSDLIPIVVLNESLYGRKINVLAKGNIRKGTPLFEIKKSK